MKTSSHKEEIWPQANYSEQIKQLKKNIGRKIFIMEAKFSGMHITPIQDAQPYELLAIVPFPKADPTQHLLPHLLVLDDGRGINLGRIIRITIESAYTMASEQTLFNNLSLKKMLIHEKRSLSKYSIHNTSKKELANLLGYPMPRRMDFPTKQASFNSLGNKDQDPGSED